MIVERRTYKVKHMCEQAAADFSREAFKVLGYPNMKRTYMPISGPNNVMHQEFEFKDWQEREQFWSAFYALPQMPEWMEKWRALTDSGGDIEFSRLME